MFENVGEVKIQSATIKINCVCIYQGVSAHQIASPKGIEFQHEWQRIEIKSVRIAGMGKNGGQW